MSAEKGGKGGLAPRRYLAISIAIATPTIAKMSNPSQPRCPTYVSRIHGCGAAAPESCAFPALQENIR